MCNNPILKKRSTRSEVGNSGLRARDEVDMVWSSSANASHDSRDVNEDEEGQSQDSGEESRDTGISGNRGLKTNTGDMEDSVLVPIRKYLHQDFKHWFARLLNRPGIEDTIDNHLAMLSNRGYMSDIWDAPTFQAFKDEMGQPFCRRIPDGEGRYVFSLASDGFNPYHAKEAKQTVTSTGIYMVLLNLPPHLRYLPENMYLAGVIPGPSKPSVDQINHFLELIVANFRPFWSPGVYFTRTFRYPGGRTAKSVIVPLVCDSLAARQMAGFTAVTSTYFCTCCKLSVQQLENFDRNSWPKRDLDSHRRYAQAWKLAKSTKEREELEGAHGIRWTPLLDLPYWNPILFTVVDSMHNLYLGLIQNHCRVVWGIDVENPGGDGMLRPEKQYNRPSSKVIAAWVAFLKQQRSSEMLEKSLIEGAASHSLLWHICKDMGIRRVGSKQQLIKRIVHWVSFVVPTSLNCNVKSFAEVFNRS
jgi:hypothetical protein